MFTIGLCDDEKEIRDNIKQICEKSLFHKEIEYQFVEYDSGEALLQALQEEEHPQIDFLLLDIEMKGMSGLQLRDCLVSHDSVRRIVFVSSHTESVMDAFGFKTVGFVSKPIQEEKIQHKLEMIIQEYMNQKMVKVGGSDTNPIFLDLDQVLYLEADGNYTRIFSTVSPNEVTSSIVSTKLGEIEKNVSAANLIRVHKSYMVNLKHVTGISDKVSFCGNNETVPVGRKYRDEAHQLFMNFVVQKAKEMF